MTSTDLFSRSRAFVPCRCGKWYAWHDFSTGASPTLYVTGECWPDVRGICVTLRRAEAQGSNARILVLENVVTADCGASVASPIPMQYEEQTLARYTQVSIQPDGLLLDVIVVS